MASHFVLWFLWKFSLYYLKKQQDNTSSAQLQKTSPNSAAVRINYNETSYTEAPKLYSVFSTML